MIAGEVHQDLACVVSFLREIGLPVQVAAGAQGFLPGVRVERGGLIVDPGAEVSDLLHEAAHLSLFPGEFRPLASGNLSAAFQAMLRSVDLAGDPDSLRSRACMQCSDPEATAWAWAAGRHLGLPPEKIVRDSDYDHTGAEIRLALSHRAYAGIHGLAHAGFCAARPGPYAQATGLPVFPKLVRWLQADFSSAQQLSNDSLPASVERPAASA